ncbi:MAG: sulfatase-like hydrolase/transferase [Deltaproteobacteria bacterium]|nr:sulfatase-like hydrolase/transferase [Deltaproteobacteria bacterium]
MNKMAAKIKPTLLFLLAWAFLNVLLNIKYPARELNWLMLFKFSPEALGVMAIILIAAWTGLRPRTAIFLPLTAFVIFLRIFRIGDIMVPMFFFRPFNLFLDSQFLPDLVHLLYTTFSRKTFTFVTILASALLVGITWAVWVSLKTIHRYLSNHRNRCRVMGLVISILMVLPYLPAVGNHIHSGIFASSYFYRVVEEFDFILHVKGYRQQRLGVIEAVIEKQEQIPSSLDKLQNANVYLIFIESYGHTIFADKRHFRNIKSFLEATEKDLSAGGFSICSTFFNSPTYGGTSWLAHATLAGGVHLENQMNYNLLITSKAKPIASFFEAAGYRTISAMPGTQWPWPEGAFFGYQQKYYAWNFDYQGPTYGWSTMPDQYVFDFIYRQEIQNQQQPLFIEFILVSSHAPFHRQPPYLKDWSQIGNGAIYREKDIISFPVVWPDLSNASEAYVAAIRYDLNVIAKFIRGYLKDNSLIIILGDHQPNVQITGKARLWSVPVHVISRNRDLLQPFRSRGYTPGLIPSQPPPHRGMETFLYDFLSDFSTPMGDKDISRFRSAIKQQIER